MIRWFPTLSLSPTNHSTQSSILQNVPDLSSAIEALKKQPNQTAKHNILLQTLEEYEQLRDQLSSERYSAQAPRILEMARHILDHIEEIPQENIDLFKTCLEKGYVLEFGERIPWNIKIPNIFIQSLSAIPDGLSNFEKLLFIKIVKLVDNDPKVYGKHKRDERIIEFSVNTLFVHKQDPFYQTRIKSVLLEEFGHAFFYECETTSRKKSQGFLLPAEEHYWSYYNLYEDVLKRHLTDEQTPFLEIFAKLFALHFMNREITDKISQMITPFEDYSGVTVAGVLERILPRRDIATSFDGFISENEDTLTGYISLADIHNKSWSAILA